MSYLVFLLFAHHKIQEWAFTSKFFLRKKNYGVLIPHSSIFVHTSIFHHYNTPLYGGEESVQSKFIPVYFLEEIQLMSSMYFAPQYPQY